MSQPPPVLQARGLGVGYRWQRVASDITLEIERGQILCLLGPNGSGKTTLFKTLLGLLPAQAGELYMLGQPVAGWSRTAFARHVGYVPQAHDGIFPFTVEQVVLMGRAARIGRFASPSSHDRRVAGRCMETLGIAALAARSYTAISGGERQLALIARALAQEPVLLVMDEPTASLDFGNQIRVLEHVARLRAEGIAILLSTHQPEHALRCADRIALLARGHIAAIGAAAAVATPANLAQLYDVPEHAITANLAHFAATPPPSEDASA
ncbi:MAG: ABC transporter ATP-binding protein [Stenotrophomonas sp.]